MPAPNFKINPKPNTDNEMKDSMIAVFKDRSVKVLHIDSLKVLE